MAALKPTRDRALEALDYAKKSGAPDRSRSVAVGPFTRLMVTAVSRFQEMMEQPDKAELNANAPPSYSRPSREARWCGSP